jgi:acyl-CoA thioesterase-1
MVSQSSYPARAYGRRWLWRQSLGLLALGAIPAKAAEIRLMMLGDSITAGYGLARGQALPARLEAALRAKGRAVRVIDAGVSGDTTAGGRARLDWALAENPHAVIVALGGNDGLRALEPRSSRANLAAILDALAAKRLPTMLTGMLAPPNLGAEYGREFASSFSDLARERPGVVFYPFLLDGVAGVARLNQGDGIHPNAEGARVVAGTVWGAMGPLLRELVAP